MRNPSFDDPMAGPSSPPGGWEIAVYGAQPTLAPDGPAPGLGGHSLRIHADEPSDTAVYQDIPARAGTWYRLTGWVRTEDLKADTAVYGAFCACDGAAPFCISPNTRGTTDWQKHGIVFRAPSSGALRVAVFLVGFGKGTGTVWFDGLTLEEVPSGGPECDRIVVHREPIREEPISPLIYGNFIEFLDHHVQGMRAQMLDDPSFEGILPPAEWCHWQTDKDTNDHPWIPTGLGGDGRAEIVSEGAFNGAKCARVTIPTNAGNGWGIRQSGLSLKAGERYALSLYLRQEGLAGPVEVNLGHYWGAYVSSYARAEIGNAGTEWSRHTVTLRPDTSDRDADISIRIASPGTLYVDQVTLAPEAGHLHGWRRDVVDATRDLRPRVLRFGGSAVIFYDWKRGIGNPDLRVPFHNTVWGRMEPNDVGMDEFLEFCELVGAEPLICASYNTGAPEDAAAQVEYCNGAPETKWGAVRARNGRVRPYNVRYWQVGNEKGGEEYEAKFVAYVRAMRAVDPSIEILASSAADGIMRAGADVIDYMSPHYYTRSLHDVVADIEVERERIARLGKGRRIRLGITEWNQSAGDWGAARALMATQENALFCARELAIYQRNSDMIAIANRSNLTNSWCAGVIQTTPDGLYVTPAYYALQLMSTWCGQRPMRVTDAAGNGLLGAEFGSALDASATVSEDGARLTVCVVNDGPDPVETTLDLHAYLAGRRSTSWHVLAAEGPNAVNEATRPDRVRPRTESARLGPETKRTFAPWSMTLLVVDLE